MLNEAKRRGIPIYPPHVNAGGLEYEAEGSGIRVPLVVINGVGLATARRIAANRRRRGAFRSLADFSTRLSLPDRIVEALTLAGALHGLDETEWRLTAEASGEEMEEALMENAFLPDVPLRSVFKTLPLDFGAEPENTLARGVVA